MLEGHLLLPWAHRIRDHDSLHAYIAFMARLGLSKFRQHRTYGVERANYVERHTDYIWHHTNYLSCPEVLALARRTRLRASFRYTTDFYAQKLRSTRGPRLAETYTTDRSALLNWLAVAVLKYVSSICLFLEKREAYVELERELPKEFVALREAAEGDAVVTADRHE